MAIGHNSDGFKMLIEQDETIRPDTSLEGLAQLRPVFDPVNGTVTGHLSQISGGACDAANVCRKSPSMDVKIRARVRSWLMLSGSVNYGLRPVPASQKALKADLILLISVC